MENDVEADDWQWQNGFSDWFERLQGNMPEGSEAEATGGFIGAVLWVIGNFIEAFYNILYAIAHPGEWLAWVNYINTNMPDAEVKESLMRFIYYGGSVELFFAFFTVVLIVAIIGFINNRFMWGTVRTLEFMANWIGRIFAYAGDGFLLEFGSETDAIAASLDVLHDQV